MAKRFSLAFFASPIVIAASLLLAGCGGTGGGDIQHPPVKLISIAVTPVNASVVAGNAEQYTAMGTYSDSSTKDITSSSGTIWSSSNQAVATVAAAGAAQAVAAGTTTISAASGSVSGSTTLTVTAAVKISVSIAPQNPSVVSGATLQFTATVTGTSNTAVTWSSSVANTISSTGLFTAPTVTAQTTAKVTATSQADTTKSASTTVTVTPQQSTDPTITSYSVMGVPPGFPILTDEPGLFVNFTINGYFPANGTLNFPDWPPADPIGNAEPVTQIFLSLFPIDTPHFIPGWHGMQSCESDGVTCGALVYFSLAGNQNTAVFSSPTSLLQKVQGAPYTVDTFTETNGKWAKSGSTGISASAIAFDSITGYVVLADFTEPGIYVMTQSGTRVALIQTPGLVGALAARDGMACYTRSGTGGNAFCFSLTGLPAVVTKDSPNPVQESEVAVPIQGGSGSFAITMSNGVSNDDVYVLNPTNVTLYRTTVNVPQGGKLQALPEGSVMISDLTPSAQIQAQFADIGGWYVQAFDTTSPNMGDVAVMGPHLNVGNTVSFALAWVDGEAMTETGAAVTLSPISVRMVADQAHGVMVVASVDSANVITHLTSVDPATGVHALGSSSSNFPVGLAVSPDGTMVAICMQESCVFLPNQ